MVRAYGLGATPAQITSVVGGGLLTAAPFTGPAAPFVAIAGAVAELLGAIGIGNGCGQTCIAATEYANQFATLIQQNKDAYFSVPAPRPKSVQTQALANFDALWNGLISVQACGNPSLGDPGKRCISERARGGRFDAFTPFRDPIANDPDVYSDSLSVSSVLGPGGLDSSKGLLAVGAVLLIIAGVSEN